MNVNTAPKEVLDCLPGLTDADAQRSVAKRNPGVDNGTIGVGVRRADAGQDRGGVSVDAARSYQYSADVVAVSGDGRAYSRVSMVVDSQKLPAKIVYRRDLTSLGWPLPARDPAALRSGKGLGFATNPVGTSRRDEPLGMSRWGAPRGVGGGLRDNGVLRRRGGIVSESCLKPFVTRRWWAWRSASGRCWRRRCPPGRGRGAAPAAELVYPEGLVLTRPEELGKALAAFLRDNQFTATDAVVGIPARWLVVKPKDVPPADAATLVPMLRLQAEADFSSELKDLVYDFVGGDGRGAPGESC